MVNSPLIDGGGVPPPDFYAFLTGDDPARSACDRLAWRLEHRAAALGWPAGHVLGSEAALARTYGVGRETLREAVRIVEWRGAMRMTRGRFGGLTVVLPTQARVVERMGLYLHMIGCGAAQAHGALSAIARTGIGEDSLVLTLARGSIETLRAHAVPPAAGAEQELAAMDLRALTIARRLIATGLRAGRVRLGSAWELSADHAASPRTVRQALRMLADFELVESRRGRGGGVFLKPPSSVGLVRQLFPFFAARGHRSGDLLAAIWALNLAHLRLACTALGKRDAAARASWRDAALRDHHAHAEPVRWILLQQAIARVADNPLLDALARCFACYQLRIGPPPPPYSAGVAAELAAAQRALILAAAAGDRARADAIARGAQALIDRVVAAGDQTAMLAAATP